MEALIETAQGELFFNFGSDFLNACYSVWQRYTRRIGIQDCTYSPRAFRLLYTEEPYALSSYDAYTMFKILADAISGEDFRPAAYKWLNLYLGGDYDSANSSNYCLDYQLRRIDESLVQEHMRILRRQSELEEACKSEPGAQQILDAARTQAQDIIDQARIKANQIIANAQELEKRGTRLRNDGERAGRNFYNAAESAERQRKQQAEQELEQARQEARKIAADASQKAEGYIQNAQNQADDILKNSYKQAAEAIAAAKAEGETLTARARAQANAITQKALDEKYAAQNEGMKEHMDAVLRQFAQVQEGMRAVEAQFAQAQLMKIFDSFYSLYDLIDVNRQSLQTLPEEYSYISENMDAFLEIIQEGLADFGIQTILSEPGSAYDGKRHEAQGSAMFDPAAAVIKRSLRAGFVNRATGNVLKKEQVEISRN